MSPKKRDPKDENTKKERNVKKALVELRQTAPSSEFSTDFIDRMLFHMGGRSYDKYGAVAERYPKKEQALQKIVDRFTKYLYTRNRKFLIDAANFSMIEFMHPSIEGAFFAGTDSDATS